MAKIQFSHISKTFLSGTEAVKNFNLEVEDGEFLVIVGSSGSGKSTILRMVAGLDEITTGELKIDGKVVNDLDPKHRNIAMVFQNYALFPNMTVEANMEFALKMQRVPKKERRKKVEEMAKVLKVDDILKRKAKGLSGGQCQRIAIGRALVCEPKVFLMDEPLSNLDASMRTELREEIAELQKRLGVTTLYVTHDQTEAMTLGNRVVVMDKGEIQQVDTPQNIYCKPQNTFVSRFVGGNTMNLFRAKCQEQLGKVVLVVGEHTIDIPEWKGQALKEREYVGKEVIVGIRAEDIYPDCEGTVVPDTLLSMFKAKVEAVDVLGAEKKLHLRLGEEEISAMARTYASIEIGEQISLRLDVNQMHIFDAETELAVLH
jgi:multiple sugar transport system ATP-binding protein